MKNFDTYKEAKIYLEEHRKELYKQITDSGDVVLSDSSFIGSSWIDSNKYTVFMMIMSNRMYEDIKNFKPIDIQAEELKMIEELNNFYPQGKLWYIDFSYDKLPNLQHKWNRIINKK